MMWGQMELEEVEDLYFLGYGQNFTSKNQIDSYKTAHDLYLLSRCNYTILTRGTFSLWSGYLNGGGFYIGERIYHKNRCKFEICKFEEKENSKVSKIFVNSIM